MELLAMKERSKPTAPEESVADTLVVESPRPADTCEPQESPNKEPEPKERPVATPARASMECCQSQDAQVMPRSPVSFAESIPPNPLEQEEEGMVPDAASDPYAMPIEDEQATANHEQAGEANLVPQLVLKTHSLDIIYIYILDPKHNNR